MASRYLAIAMLSIVATPATAVSITDFDEIAAAHYIAPPKAVFDATLADPALSDLAAFGQAGVTSGGFAESNTARTNARFELLLPIGAVPEPVQPIHVLAPVNTAQPASIFQPTVWGIMMLSAGTLAAVIRRRRLRYRSSRHRSGRRSR